VAAATSVPDGEIIALGDEIVLRAEQAERLQEERIDPFEERYQDILHDTS
jgi:hypothetical protein